MNIYNLYALYIHINHVYVVSLHDKKLANFFFSFKTHYIRKYI